MQGERKAVLARIEGRVQGVWYRGWTVERATGLGLSGWVRNRADGSVEALFAGPATAVDAMLSACRDGPPAAVVRDVLTEEAGDPGPGGFHQRPTV
ncbi:MAG TPA: acylphosphatase [Azospirillum sp.]|nr:acylphosphatase [Azospirillum sp.]